MRNPVNIDIQFMWLATKQFSTKQNKVFSYDKPQFVCDVYFLDANEACGWFKSLT